MRVVLGSLVPRLCGLVGTSAWLVGCVFGFPDSSAEGSGNSNSSGTAGSGAGASGSTTSGLPIPSSSSSGLPEMIQVSGVVVDDDGLPVDQAMIMQGGGEVAMVTGPDGNFTLQLVRDGLGVPTAVAAKVGYRAAGLELTELPEEPITLVLGNIAQPDNDSTYTFGKPGVGIEALDNSTAYCGHCHMTFAEQFQMSAHSRSTKNPKLHDIYSGVASGVDNQVDCVHARGHWRLGEVPGQPGVTTMKCYVGDSVLKDLNECGNGPTCDDPAVPPEVAPTQFGGCADCHAIAMDGPLGGRDLLEAQGTAFEHGNHCDACHHVRDIDLSAPPGVGGRLIMQRPWETQGEGIGAQPRQVMFGPLPDVPNSFMGGSYQPKFSSAEFCAGCHEQKQAALVPNTTLDARFAQGLPTHGTYSEWLESPFNPSAPCQTCHMPPVESLFNAIDAAKESNAGIAFGFERSSEQLRSHMFLGPLHSEPGFPHLIDSAATLTISGSVEADELIVQVDTRNVGAGHALPTGEPMRSLLLLVSAVACDGSPLQASSGMTVPVTGGTVARGVVGDDVSVLPGGALAWQSFAVEGSPGYLVRAVRPTGTYWDYDGIGLFASDALTPEQKGIEQMSPVGESMAISILAGKTELLEPLQLLPGDILYASAPAGSAAQHSFHGVALAGVPGVEYAKTLADPVGRLQVPHHLATTIASDTRIRAGAVQSSTHGFPLPANCNQVVVTARLLYRPHPWSLSHERHWEAEDHIVAEMFQTFVIE